MKRKFFIILLLIILLFQYACDIEAPAMVLSPPLALRQVDHNDTTVSGALYDPGFNMDATKEAHIREFISDPKFIGNTSGGISAMGTCATIEFYGYNTEQGFNGYNIYAISGAPVWSLNTAWQELQKKLKFYQQAHNKTTPTNPLQPVKPGTLSDPYYASISSTQISFSGGLTRFVVVFNQKHDYDTTNPPDALTLPVYVFVTAVSLTEGAVNESLPSNVILIN